MTNPRSEPRNRWRLTFIVGTLALVILTCVAVRFAIRSTRVNDFISRELGQIASTLEEQLFLLTIRPNEVAEFVDGIHFSIAYQDKTRDKRSGPAQIGRYRVVVSENGKVCSDWQSVGGEQCNWHEPALGVVLEHVPAHVLNLGDIGRERRFTVAFQWENAVPPIDNPRLMWSRVCKVPLK